MACVTAIQRFISIFHKILQQTSWTNLYKMDSCSEQFHKFQATIDCLLDTYMPKQLVTRYKCHKPWVTPQFEKVIKQRHWAHQNQDLASFRYYRSLVRYATKFVRKHFGKSIMTNLKGNNPRKWWKHTKQLLGQTSGQDEALKAMAINEYDGNIKLLAETINKVYQSVTCGLAPLDK